MPTFEQYLAVRITRGLKAFLNLQAGVMGAGFDPRVSGSERGDQGRLVREQAEEIARLRAKAEENGAGGPDPRNIVWMFSDGRSGSTWLTRMVGDMPGHSVWREPNVGTLFGQHYYVWANDNQRGSDHFIMGSGRERWIRSIRRFVLDEARSRFPDMPPEKHLFVKEPFGSVGAPLIMEAFPESRMVFLVRDPRDVVASALDAHQEGGWSHWRTKAGTHEARHLAAGDLDAFVAERAERYMRHIGNSKVAFDAHTGRKAMIRYEELRTDALETMGRLYRELEIPVNDRRLARVVEKRSWENIPEEKKGEGKFNRKATPGGWQEDLSPAQAGIVETITAPLLQEFYAYSPATPDS